MPDAPQDESPIRAMSYTSQKKYDAQIQVSPIASFSIAAQRNIHVLFKPGAKRYMPAPPKFRDTFRNIRIIKIFQKVKSEHTTKPYRHIRISRKIKIELQGIRNRPPTMRSRNQHYDTPPEKSGQLQLPKDLPGGPF